MKNYNYYHKDIIESLKIIYSIEYMSIITNLVIARKDYEEGEFSKYSLGNYMPISQNIKGIQVERVGKILGFSVVCKKDNPNEKGIKFDLELKVKNILWN